MLPWNNKTYLDSLLYFKSSVRDILTIKETKKFKRCNNNNNDDDVYKHK